MMVRFEGNSIPYKFEKLKELVLAYAISSHKSQGSKYHAVVVPVLTQHYIMLQRNLLCTAITQAEDLVVTVGTKRAFGTAVNNNELRCRTSGLAYRLRVLPAREATLTWNRGKAPVMVLEHQKKDSLGEVKPKMGSACRHFFTSTAPLTVPLTVALRKCNGAVYGVTSAAPNGCARGAQKAIRGHERGTAYDCVPLASKGLRAPLEQAAGDRETRYGKCRNDGIRGARHTL